MLVAFSDQPDQTFEFGLASDDEEARSLGWPCVGAHRAVARILWESGLDIVVVPRGSTIATAAAADADDRSRKG